jgi:hypothetical protein
MGSILLFSYYSPIILLLSFHVVVGTKKGSERIPGQILNTKIKSRLVLITSCSMDNLLLLTLYSLFFSHSLHHSLSYTYSGSQRQIIEKVIDAAPNPHTLLGWRMVRQKAVHKMGLDAVHAVQGRARCSTCSICSIRQQGSRRYTKYISRGGRSRPAYYNASASHAPIRSLIIQYCTFIPGHLLASPNILA